MTLDQILAKRNALRSQLAAVEAQIENYGNATPISIRTHRNIKNSAYLGIVERDDYLVFADEGLAEFASPYDKQGWMTSEAWSRLKTEQYYDDEMIWSVE